MAKKSFNEKLRDSKNMPEILEVTDPKKAVLYGGTKMLIAPPLAYDEIMRTIPYGQLITTEKIRDYLARKHDADFTCPLTAGIFMNIAANASFERGTDETPYWRTLRKNGELNDKYPGGVETHKQQLESEGHIVIQKGKRYLVENYLESMHELE